MPKKMLIGVRIWFVSALVTLSACASAPPASSLNSNGNGNDPGNAEARSAGSTSAPARLEVTYFLGHGRRRFLMESREGQVSGESYVDRALLKKTNLDPRRFSDYYAKVYDYVKQRRGLASAPSTPSERECRDPFKVVIGAGDAAVETVEGCRQDGRSEPPSLKSPKSSERDSESFNRLVDEGEFLIYSSK